MTPPKHPRSERNKPLLLSYQTWKARPNGLEKKKVVMMCSTFGKRLGQSVKAGVVLRWAENQLAGPGANEEANEEAKDDTDHYDDLNHSDCWENVHFVLKFIPMLEYM